VTLPLVNEVRAARAAADEAQRAALDAVRMSHALASTRTLAPRSDPGEVGLDALRSVAASWPALEHLAQDLTSTLADRRARIGPRGAEAESRAAEASALRVRQQQEWQQPKHRRSVAALHKRLEAQAAVERELMPLESEVLGLTVLVDMLETWLPKAQAADKATRAAILAQLGPAMLPILDGLPGEFRTGRKPTLASLGALADRARERRSELSPALERTRRSREKLVVWIEARTG
jgi:hypothetical protein